MNIFGIILLAERARLPVLRRRGITMAKILVVDDNEDLRNTVIESLQEDAHDIDEAANVESAMAKIDGGSFDIILVDMRMPLSSRTKRENEKAGIEVIDYAIQQEPNQICIVMTAYGSVENMYEAMQQGAWDYIEKPFSENRLLSRIDSALELQESGRSSPIVKYQPLIGGSQATREIHNLISKAAKNDATVLISGETGTGKELVARAIHSESSRRHGPFVAVNCAAVHPDRMEDDLFGHVKGGFTGAERPREGYFVTAEGGTIFLDEIGDMPMDVQASVLRVLQERTIRAIGMDSERLVDVRVISATNRDTVKAVKEGKLREDLYYRLNVIPIAVPPLRERKEDIPLLVAYFLKKHGDSSGLKEVSDEAMELLCEQDWPGNVRELEHTIQRVITSTEDKVVQPADLSLQLPISSVGSRWSDEPERALYESFKRLVELGNSWNTIENYLVALAISETEQNSEAAKLIGMPANTLRDKRKPIRRNLKNELREFLRKQGESESEIKDKIDEIENQIVDLKTKEQRRRLAEVFPLYTESR